MDIKHFEKIIQANGCHQSSIRKFDHRLIYTRSWISGKDDRMNFEDVQKVRIPTLCVSRRLVEARSTDH
jgi:hypothetical protein